MSNLLSKEEIDALLYYEDDVEDEQLPVVLVEKQEMPDYSLKEINVI
ncbi:MAG: hypothetical protein QF552_04360 [Litorilituus sp.]|jgi:flagellar motor switch protein FliM|nr:hypothetical protein [Litorilituus sp.]